MNTPDLISIPMGARIAERHLHAARAAIEAGRHPGWLVARRDQAKPGLQKLTLLHIAGRREDRTFILADDRTDGQGLWLRIA